MKACLSLTGLHHTPSDIVFVISVLKNGHNVWDKEIRMKHLGMVVHAEMGAKNIIYWRKR
jgi:hypothetical protein